MNRQTWSRVYDLLNLLFPYTMGGPGSSLFINGLKNLDHRRERGGADQLAGERKGLSGKVLLTNSIDGFTLGHGRR